VGCQKPGSASKSARSGDVNGVLCTRRVRKFGRCGFCRGILLEFGAIPAGSVAAVIPRAAAPALAKSLAVDARVEVPERVYLEEDKRTITFELPKSTGPLPHVEVEFVVDGDPSVPAGVFSSQRKMNVGEELRLEDGVWRVIRVEDTNDGHIDQIAYCRRTPYSDT
jgi:hypothetical protein